MTLGSENLRLKSHLFFLHLPRPLYVNKNVDVCQNLYAQNNRAGWVQVARDEME